ncbi:multisubstrate pseudouridine synthase 7 [Friedmanniomyces endolithicus]|nr:multisubstrate pseudouridine synthase 7 [Friedmanniomyces endolithicus]KAK0828904.1 multisubstrate pseudouridine synthase 7 [Friedmanniomyces endolithicus]
MATKRSLDGEDGSPNKRTRTQPDKPSADLSQEAQECAVGVTVFVAPKVPGFECVFKHRYTDFLVHEILPNGHVLHLTDKSEARKPAKQTKPVPEPSNEHKIEDPSDEQPGSEDKTQKPPAEEPPEPAPTVTGQDENPTLDMPELSVEDRSTLVDIFGNEVTQKILNLQGAVLRNPERKPREHNTVISDVISEKTKRTEAHMAVRRIFNSKLQTETLQDQPGVIAVKASPPVAVSGARGQHGGDRNGAPAPAKGKVGWQELGGEYLHFTLYKENKDTMEVLSFMASQLKIPARNFEFAGTKDRRGVTVQKVALFRMRAERIANLKRMARGWKAGGFEHKKHGLELGELAGNEFVLTLRDCHFPSGEGLDATERLELAERLVSEAAESFKAKGFLNYYGLQRFGSFSTGTHTTGMKILQGDLKGAVESILTYSSDLLPENVGEESVNKVPQDDIYRADVIRKWREGSANAMEIRDKLPRRFSAESAIMQYLSKKDKKTGKLMQDEDWQGALMQIQRGLRLMYVHAYQSLVWNMVAGRRWELYGEQVVEGDLVIVGEKDGKATSGKQEETDQDGEPIVKPAADDSVATEDSFTRARPLSKEEAGSGKYDIFDLVLPQPGFDVLYPGNEVGKYYEEFMGSEAGGGLDPHKMRRSWKDASLSGSYRKMMTRPLNGIVECRVTPYEGADEQLVETDLEKMRKRGRGNDTDATAAGASTAVVSNEEEGPIAGGADHNELPHSDQANGDQPNGSITKSNIAVVMRFQLGSSQYATMALREMCKGGARAYKPEFNTVR